MITNRKLLTAVLLTAALGFTAYVEATTPDTPPGADARTSTRAMAPERWQGGHFGPHAGFGHVLGKLTLTAEQKAQVKALYEQAKPQLHAMREQARASHELLESTPPTDPGYAAAITAAKANAANRIQYASDLRSKIYALLTPAQQAQIPGILATEKSAHEARKAVWRAKHASGP